MPYEFTEYEPEPEPQASSGRAGRPPRKLTTAGVLDPPVPPKRSPGPLASIPAKWWLRAFAGIVLAIAVLVTILLLFAPR
jgi:hypothetical protein